MSRLASIAGLIGMSRKSGKLAVGHAAVAAAIKKKRARLIMIAEDASGNTRDRFTHLARGRGITVIAAGDKAQWGALLGRADTAVIAVLDPGFADGIRARFGDGGTPRQS